MKIKLSHPVAIKFVALLASWVIRLWLGTLQYRCVMDSPEGNPNAPRRRALYMFWHETMLLPAYTHARTGFSILISTHRDGELIAQIIRFLGGGAIRGSTTRGGAAAVIGMLRDRRARHLSITPDGPRGPRRVLQIGAVYLASRGGMPLIPIGAAVSDCWRIPSWDRMIAPKPGTRARYVIGEVIEIPANLSRDELEVYRQKAQAALDDAQARAERLAAGDTTHEKPLLTLEQLRSQE